MANDANLVKDMTEIIKIASKHNVKEIRIGEIHVIFRGSVKKKQDNLFVQPPSLNPEMKAKAELLQSQTLEKNEFETREAQLARMLLEDPLQYEELLSSGDLEDDVTRQ